MSSKQPAFWQKTRIVLRREYLTRLRSKWFLVATFLGPFILLLFFSLPILFMYLAERSGGEHETIAVIDKTGELFAELEAEVQDAFTLIPAVEPEDSLQQRVIRGDLDGYLVIPAEVMKDFSAQPVLYMKRGGGISRIEQLSNALSRLIKEKRLIAMGASPEILDVVSKRIRLRTIRLSETGEVSGSAASYGAIAYIMGTLIYVLVLAYGGLVMRGVLEEKTNRIVEIIVSSVRPFQLMMGKVLGIGLLGLTQAVVWAIILLAGLAVVGSILAHQLNPADLQLPQGASQEALLAQTGIQIPTIPLSLVVFFLIFFLGGYLLYASLFAAIAAGADQESDVQSLQFPITFLVIIPFLALPLVLEQPDATLAVVLSLIPFFSPVLMVARLALTAVPVWQWLGAILLLFLAFAGMVWVAGRIYRVGILMYGRKPRIKDLVRWAIRGG